MFGNPMELLIIAGAAILLFGADKVPKLARGLGQAKTEFMVGQTEAEIAAERQRAEIRARAEAAAAAPPEPPSQTTPPPTTSTSSST
jgi:sec-independent protein translocase protein TatA